MEELNIILNEEDRPTAEAITALLTEKKFAQVREELSVLPAADIAELFIDIPEEKEAIFFRI